MDDALVGLNPPLLWHYFGEISKLPRISGDEGKAAAWIADEGRRLGLQVEQDAVGNVLLRKPASPGRERVRPTAMQAHIDMVTEKNESTLHDFSRDPLRLRRVGEMLHATGTTLGADDGIGVAAGLAVMASKDLEHGPLELLVTVDEESGLTGVNALRPKWMQAEILLNLDNEEEGFVCIGCAGGVDTIATRRVRWEAAPLGAVHHRLKVSGCKGGHSGIDIHHGRANAIKLLAAVLNAVRGKMELWVGPVVGGNRRNAIPREASALLCVDRGADVALRAEVAAQLAHWRAAYGSFDPGIEITLEPQTVTKVMAEPDARALVGLLLALPHGVEAMSPDIPGLVQTSTNVGVVRSGEVVEVNSLTRSSVDASKVALAERIDATCAIAGFDTERAGDYCGWKPEPGAGIVKLVDEVWQAQAGQPIKVVAVHAGLECGLIGDKYPGMEMASIGPDVFDVHTPDEHVRIASVERFWTLLTAVLARIDARA